MNNHSWAFRGLSRAFRIQDSINPRADCNEHHTGEGFHALGGRNQHVGEYPEHTHDKQRRDDRVTGATERQFDTVGRMGASKEENRPDGQGFNRGGPEDDEVRNHIERGFACWTTSFDTRFRQLRIQ